MEEKRIGNTGWSLKKEYYENDNEKRAYNDGVYDFETFTYTHEKWGKIEFQRYYGGDFPFDNLTGNFASNNEQWYEIIMPDGEKFSTQDDTFIFKCDFLEEVTNEFGLIEYRYVEDATPIQKCSTTNYKNRGRHVEVEEEKEQDVFYKKEIVRLQKVIISLQEENWKLQKKINEQNRYWPQR